jgi:hypothetical protein
MHTFVATLASAMDGAGDAWTRIAIPADVASSFRSTAMVKVRGTLNGVAYRSSLMPDGQGGFHMMVNAAIREEAGVGSGDEVTVQMEVDDAPRTVRTPADLAAGLRADPRANAFWGALSYSNKRLYVDQILEAKQPETRAKRVAETVQAMRDGKKRQR